MRKVLTARAVAQLRPPATGLVDYFDDPTGKGAVVGLHLRVSSTGHRVWRYVYRFGKAQRVLSWSGTFSLAEARDEARKAAGALAHGEDPAEAKREERDAESVASLVDLFLMEYVEKKQLRDAKEIQRIFKRCVLPEWKHKKAKDITRADVKVLLKPIAERAPVMANRVRARISKLFNWAIGESLLDANPATKLTAEAEHSRERTLTADEIRAFWAACDGLGPIMGNFFRLRLLTGQRGGEVAGMKWTEIDESGEWWLIPSGRAKNTKAHRVYLSAPARAILAAVPRTSDEWVFPSPRKGHISNYQKAWDRLCEAAGLTDVVSHDLRRTAATLMGDLGVPREIISKVLNHADPSVTATYDRASRDPEKRKALTRLGAHVLKVVAGEPTGAEVVRLDARRGG